MPTPPKALDSMAKNLTAEERALREQAERGVIPDRGREVKLERPAIMTKNAAAGRYWKKVLDRMQGLIILDDLDSDALGVYCVMMARYETQCKLLALVSKQLKEAKDDPEAVAEAVSKLDTVAGKCSRWSAISFSMRRSWASLPPAVSGWPRSGPNRPP